MRELQHAATSKTLLKQLKNYTFSRVLFHAFKLSSVHIVLIMFLTCDMQAWTSTPSHIKHMSKTLGKQHISTCVISCFQNVVFSTCFKHVLGMRRGSVNLDTLNPNALASKCRTYSTIGSGGTRLP